MANSHALAITTPPEPSSTPGQDAGGVKTMANSHALAIPYAPPEPPSRAPRQGVSATRVGYQASATVVVAFNDHPIARSIICTFVVVSAICMLIYWLNEALKTQGY